MSRRREANRAEALVRGIGAIVMLMFLWGMAKGTPGLLRGQSPGEALAALLTNLLFLVFLLGAITVVGLVVWLKVLKGPRNRLFSTPKNQFLSRPSLGPSGLTCADCGTAITRGIANYCQKRPGTFGGKFLCMSCQARYRR